MGGEGGGRGEEEVGEGGGRRWEEKVGEGGRGGVCGRGGLSLGTTMLSGIHSLHKGQKFFVGTVNLHIANMALCWKSPLMSTCRIQTPLPNLCTQTESQLLLRR